ncbi:MAG TPA: CHASE3 domain-containing protein, partial [Candidatus Baltobacteraceae bacterium]|nr:CHASE3 domain-containing protein [Candidatus Baltobacteraceae bacterium]
MSPGTSAKPPSLDAGALAVQFNRGIRNFAVAFLLALVVLPIVSWWAIYRTQALSAQIAAAEESRILMSRALRYAVDEDTGVRGYLDTHEPAFLGPEREAHPALVQLLHVMPGRFVESGFSAALNDLADFTQAHALWYSTVVSPLLVNPARRDRVALMENGNQYMDRMRADARRIQSNGLLVAQQSAQRTSAVIEGALIVTALWIVAVAIFSILLQHRAARGQRQLLESLVHEREEVSRLSEWRARLLAMLAHDFKSQLTVLIGASHLLEDFPQRRSDMNLLASLRNASYALAEMADNAILLA